MAGHMGVPVVLFSGDDSLMDRRAASDAVHRKVEGRPQIRPTGAVVTPSADGRSRSRRETCAAAPGVCGRSQRTRRARAHHVC
ncbi:MULTISPECIES: hypothetical protein [unclassified Streptomyces]